MENTIKWDQQQTVLNILDQDQEDLTDYEDDDHNQQKQTSIQNQMDVQQTAYRLNYQRVLHKIIRNSQNSKEGMFDMVDNFKESNEGLFNHYYQRASMLDRLSGLSQNELKGML